MNKEMEERYTYASLTRISDLNTNPFQVRPLERHHWKEGDYIVVEVTGNIDSPLKIELTNGRMVSPMLGDHIVGSLGMRYATLEATGSWAEVASDGNMHFLTGAGLLGKMTSKSYFLPELIEVQYRGHVYRNETKLGMSDFAGPTLTVPYTIPTILIVGTSMSAGKTVTGRIITHLLTNAGLKVAGVKFTGAGRYKDILALKDAGAQVIFDFVDVGLGSTIGEPQKILPLLRQLLSKIQASSPDIAVLEIGASPLEPYNGDLGIMAIQKQIVFTVLCASDPYAVYGVMESFSLIPDVVSGPATNTLAGQDLIKNLCNVPSLNLIDRKADHLLKEVLEKKIKILPQLIRS